MSKKIRVGNLKLTNEDIYNWYNLNLDTRNRIIYFGPWLGAESGLGTIDCQQPWEVHDWSAQNIIKGLHVLETESNEEITIKWFSYGGDFNAGMAIYDTIKECKSYVTMKCYGRVRSMGTIILQAADERLLSQNCEFLIHNGEAGYEDVEENFLLYAKEVLKSRKIMEDIYLNRIREKKQRYSRKQLKELLLFDNYLDLQDAIDLGLADGIIKI